MQSKTVAQASHHQGNSKHGESAWMQCTSNAYFVIIFFAIKSTDVRKTFDLDYILEQGDKVLKWSQMIFPLKVLTFL